MTQSVRWGAAIDMTLRAGSSNSGDTCRQEIDRVVGNAAV